jgi:hypothetical protein
MANTSKCEHVKVVLKSLLPSVEHSKTHPWTESVNPTVMMTSILVLTNAVNPSDVICALSLLLAALSDPRVPQALRDELLVEAERFFLDSEKKREEVASCSNHQSFGA